ncbi:MAG: hypothetical protein ACQEVA_16735, partial [Myxococcota bacterium]
DYHTIETPHFYVHYYTGQRDFAWRVARIHEEAHSVLTPLLDWVPRAKTHVIINDRVDTANGSANVYGRNVIRIFSMPPEPEGVLGYYDDWLRILVYHEYVHILHLDTTTEEAPIINSIIGKQWNPNQVLPRWYVEGIATMHESQRTGTGRLESSLFQMWLRTAALEESFFDLGTATGSPIEWPMGSAAYLYGGFFMDYVVDKHGGDVVPQFNDIYGSRLIPFSLNQTIESVSGQTFHELWQEWAAVEKARALARRTAVEARGRTRLEYLTDSGGENRYPRFRNGQGDLSYSSAPFSSHPSIASLEPDGIGQRAARLVVADGLSGAHDWSPDGETVFYGRRTVDKNVYSYYELFAHSPTTDSTRKITVDERAREPSVSHDGTHIVYVRNVLGSTELAMRKVDGSHGSAARVLVGADQFPPSDERHWQQISMPIFTPDDSAVVFSWWRLDRRRRDLWMYRLDAPEGERLVRLTDDAAHDLEPSFGPDGRLYFSSDRTGIYNVYAMDLDTRETWQVSNVINGVFGPRVSDDGQWVYVSSYTDQGYEIARFEHPEQLAAAPESYESGRRDYPDVDTDGWDDGSYQAWRWLKPLVFMPQFATSGAGTGLGAQLQGYDPIGHHSWSLGAAWSPSQQLTQRSLNASLNYTFGGWPLNIGLNTRYREFPRTRSLLAESRLIPFTEREVAGGYQLTYPIRAIDDNITLSHTGTLVWNEFQDEPDIEPSPADLEPQLPEFGYSANVGFSISYSNLDFYPKSVSPTDGISGRVGFNISNDFSEANLNSVFLGYSFGGYLSNPWLDNHVVMLRVDGGIIRSNFSDSSGFAIGGFSPQDVLTDIVLQQPRGAFVLHGYPPRAFVGSHYQVWRLEYRLPLLELDQGFSTVPVFFRRLKGRVFAEAGSAFDGFAADADYHPSVGAELQLESVFGYYLGGSLLAGYARGLDPEGINEWWIRYGGGF